MMPEKRGFAPGGLRSARGRLALFGKSISDRPHRPDEIGTTCGPEGMPEAANVHINCPGAEMNVTRPGGNLKISAGMDAAWVFHEVDQQAKLGRREVNDVSIAPHDVSRQVDLKIVECQHLRGFGVARGVPQRCQHPCDELLRHERPAEAFVSAGRKEFFAATFITRSQEHQDREGSRLPFEAELRAQRSHVDLGKTRVHKQNVRLEFTQPLVQSFSVLLCDDLHTDLLKDVDDKGVETAVLGSQQDRRRSSRSDRGVTQHLIGTALVAAGENSALPIGRRSELGRHAKNGWSPWRVSRSQVTLAKILSGNFGGE
jgi:hypothetical protein